ncbi:beta/gamma crystallin-related protein [Povalibacter sp.]|uniref:beta/gamma crystallin-related protein n=1 Tax=Povalibacter sp. TaxID=1962978 RepID=UPI002F3EE08C
MTRSYFTATAITMSIVGALISGAASAQNRDLGGVGMTVFADSNFNGKNATLREPVANLRSIGMNDTISSLRVAPGEQWEVCVDADFKGRCTVVSGEERDLGRVSWNDTISSVRPLRSSGSGPRPGPRDPYIVLFDQRNYRGNPLNVSSSQSGLGQFNDRAQSVTVGRGIWEVCEHANFGGRCVTLSRSSPDLAAQGLPSRVSSVRPVNGGAGPSRPPGSASIVLYDQLNYRGAAANYDAEVRDVGRFNDRAQSVTIGRGTWELCEDSDFRGRCITLRDSSPDLGRQGMLRRISSVRPLHAHPR